MIAAGMACRSTITARIIMKKQAQGSALSGRRGPAEAWDAISNINPVISPLPSSHLFFLFGISHDLPSMLPFGFRDLVLEQA
jgi:hypothetical protein